ncbi:hypothetical protein VTH06DRAFT_4644 [Thermothelomyces fergusii]
MLVFSKEPLLYLA